MDMLVAVKLSVGVALMQPLNPKGRALAGLNSYPSDLLRREDNASVKEDDIMWPSSCGSFSESTAGRVLHLYLLRIHIYRLQSSELRRVQSSKWLELSKPNPPILHLSPVQCAVYLPELTKADLLSTNGLLPVTLSEALFVALASKKPNRL
ncbi:hypothetical protein GBA52_012384 [Prunus armeniaca]|nr:hypothetical protein GBA52_012384 [Prunus armeniaca]